MGKFIVIEPSGKFRTVEMEKDSEGSCLKQLHDLVGGWIEHVRPATERYSEFDSKVDLWINEEGKLLEMEANSVATRASSLYGFDVLVGPCVIARTDDEGETQPLTQSDVEAITERLKSIGGVLSERTNG